MTKQVIAKIKLAPGEVGYYDEYSRIYLTIASPVALVYSDTNCNQIKQSIKSGRLLLIEGSFSKPDTDKKSIINEVKASYKEVKTAEPEIVLEETVVSESEEVIQEELKPRRRNRKNKVSEVVEEVTTLEEIPEFTGEE